MKPIIPLVSGIKVSHLKRLQRSGLSQEFQFHHVKCNNFNYPVGRDIVRIVKLCKVFRKKLVGLIGKDTKLQIWCRGSSGAMIAALVAQGFTNVNIIHIKKPGEQSHSHSIYPRLCCVNIIVDDFARSGKTLEAIHKQMNLNEIPLDHLCLLGSIMINRLRFPIKSLVASEIFIETDFFRSRSGKVKY